MKKIFLMALGCVLLISFFGCSAPTMSDNEIIDKAADILAEQGFDLHAALKGSGGEIEPLQNTEPSSSVVNSQLPTIEKTPAQTTEKATSDIGARKNPVPLRQTLTGYLDRYGNPVCDFEMSVIEVVRGEEAWKMIYKANMFNSEPENDQEYVVVKVRVKNTADLTGKDEAFKVSKYDFEFASSNDSISDNQPSIVVPNPSLDLALYEGSEDEGYIAFLVNKSEVNIKAVYAGSFWFLLQ